MLVGMVTANSNIMCIRTISVLLGMLPALLLAQSPGKHVLHTAEPLGPHGSKVVHAVLYDMDPRFLVSNAEQVSKVRTPADVRSEDLIAALAANGIVAYLPPGNSTTPDNTRSMDLPPGMAPPPFTGDPERDAEALRHALDEYKASNPQGYLLWRGLPDPEQAPMDE